MRTFDTGATRNDDEEQLDYEGFLHPLFVEGFGKYMHKHRRQADGSMRASDNWQKGIPKAQYMKSLFRHFVDLWLIHRGHEARGTLEDAIFGIMFNVQGYYYETVGKEPPDAETNMGRVLSFDSRNGSK